MSGLTSPIGPAPTVSTTPRSVGDLTRPGGVRSCIPPESTAATGPGTVRAGGWTGAGGLMGAGARMEGER
nr:hypothetical protein [Micromonospora sp. DSM 115978]